MWLQMPWAMSPQIWMQKLWSPSWNGSPWELPKGQMLMTQWGQSWWRNTQALPGNCNSGSGCMHRPTCDWLGDHPTGGSNTQDCNWVDLWPKGAGPKTPAGRWCKYWRGWDYSLRVEEFNILPGSPLPLAHPYWWTGRSFEIHGPKGSPGSSHELMSLWCWTPRPTPDTVLAEWLVLVAQMQREISSCEWCIQH